jgi:hypothetical protein
MAGNSVTSELASVLAYDGSRGLMDSTALRASVSTVLGATAASTVETGAAAAPVSSVLTESVRQNSDRLAELTNVFRTQIDTLAENTLAVAQNTTSSAGAGATAMNVAKSAGSMLAGGLTLSPLITGIMKLFGGGREDPAPAPLVKYAAPASIQLETGVSGGRLTPIDYDASGSVRAATPAPTPGPITVNVQAIDSRSFLDHSDAIAAAVKKAMLDSNSLNDVVAEL